MHPNGAWFLVFGAVWLWLRSRRAPGLPRPSGPDIAAGLATTLAWLAFAALAAANAEAFAQGFAYQLARKAGAARLEVLGDGRVLALAAAGLWLARRPTPVRHPRLALAGVLVALLLGNLAAHRVPNPFDFPGNVVWHRMRFSEGEPYLRGDERAFVRDFLIGLAPPGEPPWVRFHPAAEALFYADLDGVEIRVSEPVFREHQPDWYLLRTSRWRTSGRIERALFARAGIDPADQAHRILQRGDTERWYAVRP